MGFHSLDLGVDLYQLVIRRLRLPHKSQTPFVVQPLEADHAAIAVRRGDLTGVDPFADQVLIFLVAAISAFAAVRVRIGVHGVFLLDLLTSFGHVDLLREAQILVHFFSSHPVNLGFPADPLLTMSENVSYAVGAGG